jgi:HK97 family phage prohead protease
VDSYGDVVQKGAFKKTIQENARRIRHLWMHDSFQPPTAVVRNLQEVGKSSLPESVLAAFPDATGGLEVAREYLKTPRGDEILEGIRADGINEMSFAYDVVKSQLKSVETDGKEKRQIRLLSEVKLYETSDVLWGANPATVASKTAEYRLSQLEAAAAEMEAEAKAGRVLSAANLQRLKDALDVLTRILMTAEPQEDDDAKASRLLALTEQINLRLAIAERQLL